MDMQRKDGINLCAGTISDSLEQNLGIFVLTK